VVVGLVAALLQFRWMQKVRARGPDSITPNSLAQKLSEWMLKRRGIELEPAPVVMGERGTERVPCTACGETGVVLGPDGTRQPCPICQGVGFRIIRWFDADERKCPLCAGMGRTVLPGTDEVDTCPRCGGRGIIRRGAQPAAPDQADPTAAPAAAPAE